ncbi:MAG: copper chaperone PCu(A)C [Gemmatimonadaceae bacterium]
MRNWRAIFASCCSVLVGASCTPAEPARLPSLLSVRGAWARPADSGATTAVYFVLANGGATADTLRGVSSVDAEVTEMHISTRIGGMMHMSPVTALPVPADDSVSFRPLGAHVMMLRVRRRVVAYDTVTAVLTFVSGDSLTVRAGVRQP